jgi:hypothetical protein
MRTWLSRIRNRMLELTPADRVAVLRELIDVLYDDESIDSEVAFDAICYVQTGPGLLPGNA